MQLGPEQVPVLLEQVQVEPVRVLHLRYLLVGSTSYHQHEVPF